MKKNKIPSVQILIWGSWVIVIVGMLKGTHMIFSGANNVRSIITSLIIILGSTLLAVIVRLMANIGQMLFEITGFHYEQTIDLKKQIDVINNSIFCLNQDLITNRNVLHEVLQSFSGLQNTCIQVSLELQNTCIQISCDSKEMNQNIHQMKEFFEKIEAHLDLNR